MFKGISRVLRTGGIAFAATLGLSATAMADGWPEQSTPEFDALLAAARSEGELVILGDPNLSNEFVAAFEEDTGIPVAFIAGGRQEVRTRFLRETEANQATFDAFLGGFSGYELADKGLLAPVAEQLLLPEVTNPDNWRLGHIPYVDKANTYMPLPSNYIQGYVLINTNLVDEASLQSWDDLLAPAFKGQIVVHDPSFAGGGQVLATYLIHALGEDYVRELYVGQEVEVTRDYRTITDLVARGIKPISLNAVARHIVSYQAEGLDFLKVLHLKGASGLQMGGASVLAVPSSAPNPNAAAVFANWYLSKRGQTMYSTVYNTPSDRTDLEVVTWPDFINAEPGETYIDTYSEAWVEDVRPPLIETLTKILDER